MKGHDRYDVLRTWGLNHTCLDATQLFVSLGFEKQNNVGVYCDVWEHVSLRQLPPEEISAEYYHTTVQASDAWTDSLLAFTTPPPFRLFLFLLGFFSGVFFCVSMLSSRFEMSVDYVAGVYYCKAWEF